MQSGSLIDNPVTKLRDSGQRYKRMKDIQVKFVLRKVGWGIVEGTVLLPIYKWE